MWLAEPSRTRRRSKLLSPTPKSQRSRSERSSANSMTTRPANSRKFWASTSIAKITSLCFYSSYATEIKKEVSWPLTKWPQLCWSSSAFCSSLPSPLQESKLIKLTKWSDKTWHLLPSSIASGDLLSATPSSMKKYARTSSQLVSSHETAGPCLT